MCFHQLRFYRIILCFIIPVQRNRYRNDFTNFTVDEFTKMNNSN